MTRFTLQYRSRGTRSQAPWVVGSLLAASASVTTGQTPLKKVCEEPARHESFVVDSLQLVNGGTARDDVLDTLLCIAEAPDASNLTQIGAVHALFHIAQRDELARRHLLRIVESETARYSATEAACRLLVFVANKEIRDALFEHVKRYGFGTTRGAPAFTALMELGDERLLTWLQNAIRRMDNSDPRRAYYESEVQWFLVQHTVDDLLAHIRSGVPGPYPGWAIRQAMRRGADPEDVRGAVLTYFERAAGDDKARKGGRLESAVRAGMECGLLDPADLERIQVQLAIPHGTLEREEPGVWPPWAEASIAAKRAAFYGLNRNSNEEK